MSEIKVDTYELYEPSRSIKRSASLFDGEVNTEKLMRKRYVQKIPSDVCIGGQLVDDSREYVWAMTKQVTSVFRSNISGNIRLPSGNSGDIECYTIHVKTKSPHEDRMQIHGNDVLYNSAIGFVMATDDVMCRIKTAYKVSYMQIYTDTYRKQLQRGASKNEARQEARCDAGGLAKSNHEYVLADFKSNSRKAEYDDYLACAFNLMFNCAGGYEDKDLDTLSEYIDEHFDIRDEHFTPLEHIRLTLRDIIYSIADSYGRFPHVPIIETFLQCRSH